jgi:outer membrane protein TolC
VRRACQFVLLGTVTALTQPACHAQLSFYTAVDLALRNSPQVRIGAAQVQRAEAAVTETVAAYRPSFSVGSSLGYSYGFPVGQPSIYNVSAQSLALSFSQPSYIHSARAALLASQLQLKDTRQEVIYEVASNYAELTSVNQQVAAMDQETASVGKLVEIETERVEGGLDNKMELTKAKLMGAQIALRRLHLVNHAELVRTRLANLTGLKDTDVALEPQTIPQAPETSSLSATESNDGIESAYATAKSKSFTARGDALQNNRPTLAFGLEYNRYAKFNNYSDYYLHFQHNNFNVGVQITLPLFDVTRKARAKGSSADAVAASAQADQVRDQTREQMLQWKESITELSAQERVAVLQNELSQDQLDALGPQLQLGSASPGAPALTPKDEQGARIRERGYFVDVLETRFQLLQARLGLLRTMGTIEQWAKQAPTASRP